MTYRELREKQSKEFHDFPIFFAFNDKQFEEGMKSLNLKVSDIKQVYKLGSSGGFYRKSDAQMLRDMFARHEQEMKEAMKDDEFLYDMFMYELGNHEYGYTYDLFPVLEACGLTSDDIRNNQRLADALNRAKTDYLAKCE